MSIIQGMRSTPELEAKLLEFSSRGILIPRTENNRYLKVSYKGNGILISDKWNVKIYTSGSVVCADEKILCDILAGTLSSPDHSKKVLQIDDSGWGFCLLGVMVGVCDGTRVETDVVDVSFFQGHKFDNKDYLGVYAQKGLKIVTESFQATPKTHRIEICTGYINTGLKDLLRSKGFEVRVTEIKGLLQDSLEDLFKKYVHDTLKIDLAYDPKLLRKKDISDNYYKALEWGRRYAPHLLKTGWKSM